MKIFLNTFIILLIIICNSYSQSYRDIKREKEKTAKEKSEREDISGRKIKSKKVFENNILESINIYDTRGNTLEYSQYLKGETISRKYIYTFDINNNLTEESFYGGYNGTPTKIVYQYKENNKIIKKTEYDPRMKMSQITSSVYDKNDNLSKRITINWRNDTAGVIMYGYDELNRIISSKYFINVRIFDELYEYKYDSKNNIIEVAKYDNVGFVYREKRIYDEKGNDIWVFNEYKSKNIKNEKNIYYKNNNLEAVLYFDGTDTSNVKYSPDRAYNYDSNGNVQTEFIVYNDSTLHKLSSFEYDLAGNKTKEIRYDEDGIMDVELNFRYDDRGNLLQRCLIGYMAVLEEVEDEDEIKVKEYVKNPESDDCTNYEFEFYE